MKIQSDLLKNDVPATAQLACDDCIKFELRDGADIKLLFLGNSITRHGVKPELGWLGDHGMAASSKAHDYVHRLLAMLERDGKTPSCCIANMSEWEQSWDDDLLAARYTAARDFGADIIIVRLGENARLLDRAAEFMPHYQKLIDFFGVGGARVVLTDLFWRYEPFDTLVSELAHERGYGFASVCDLGDSDDMKAIGKFEHSGVAAHPGDKGMAAIAQRIYNAL